MAIECRRVRDRFGGVDRGGAWGAIDGVLWVDGNGFGRGTLPRGSGRKLDGTSGEQRPAGLVG